MPKLFTLAQALLASAMLGGCNNGGDGSDDRSLVQRVSRNSLRITVRERGELQAARDQRVTSLLEGRATLIYLIREGSVVKEGELLARLDSSAIEEKRANQAIAVAKAEAALWTFADSEQGVGDLGRMGQGLDQDGDGFPHVPLRS